MQPTNMTTNMTRDERASSCSPFIAAGGFDALKRACNDIAVGRTQYTKDVAEDMYVDLHFTYADEYDGPCFGEREVILPQQVNIQAVAVHKNVPQRVEVPQRAVCVACTESGVAAPDLVSHSGEGMTVVSQEDAKATPQKDEPSDHVASARISPIAPAPGNHHTDGPVGELHSTDAAAGRIPDETKATTASSRETRVAAVHSVGSPSTNSKVVDSAEVKQEQGEITAEQLRQEKRGSQYKETEQVKLKLNEDEDNCQSGCGLLRKTSILGVFKALRRSWSRDRTGSGTQGLQNKTMNGTEQSRTTEGKETAARAQSLHRKSSMTKAVELVRRIGSAGRRLSKTTEDQLAQEPAEVDHGVADRDRKFTMQKVADAVRRIGSVGRRSPQATDERPGNGYAGLGQAVMVADEELVTLDLTCPQPKWLRTSVFLGNLV